MVRLHAVAPESLARPSMEDLDEVTIERAKRGDEAAFRRLVDAYKSPVFRLLSRMLAPRGRRSLVEDLAQETFLRVFRAIRSFGRNGRTNLLAWILTIASNVALDELRKPNLTTTLDDAPDLRSSERADARAEHNAAATHIERALARMPPEYSIVFMLRAGSGLEYEEIAAALNIDIGTVKSRLSRARAELRAALNEEES